MTTLRIYGSLIRLLNFYFSASSNKLFLRGISISFRNAGFDGLGSAFNEILGFFKSKTCNLTNDLDDVDLYLQELT